MLSLRCGGMGIRSLHERREAAWVGSWITTLPRVRSSCPEGWPEGYPLPLLPPASFHAIEETAGHSRRSQGRKAAKSARLREEWSSSKAAAPAAPEAKGRGKSGGKPQRRWKVGMDN